MRIGWLADEPQVIGGAELMARELATHAPGWAEIVSCPPNAVAADCDAYVLHNVVSYPASVIETFGDKPVVKMVHDYWPHGDPALREWILQHAALAIFVSDPHYKAFSHTVGCRVAIVPEAVDVAKFREANEHSGVRSGVLWMAQTWAHKGITEAVLWAEGTMTPVDFYGEGPLRPREGPFVSYCGTMPYEDVPALMATYEAFLHVPQWVEPFGCAVIEAWAAGCKLLLNEQVGCVWWLENRPDDLARGVELFWQEVKLAISPAS